jgi:hypothetical protein
MKWKNVCPVFSDALRKGIADKNGKRKGGAPNQSSLVGCSGILAGIIRPCSFKLCLFLGIPLAIVKKHLAIQCTPKPVYHLSSSVGESCAGRMFRVGSLKEERNPQCLISELFENSSELLMFLPC